MYRYRGMLALLAVVLGTGCTTTFITVPTGRVDAVVFRFYKAPEGTRPVTLRITELAVQERDGASGWRTIWWVRGAARTDSVVYGAKLDGLSVVVPPTPLRQGSHYRVDATEIPLVVGGPGYSGALFTFDTGGGVVSDTR